MQTVCNRRIYSSEHRRKATVPRALSRNSDNNEDNESTESCEPVNKRTNLNNIHPLMAPHLFMGNGGNMMSPAMTQAAALAGLFGQMQTAHIKMTNRGICVTARMLK